MIDGLFSRTPISIKPAIFAASSPSAIWFGDLFFWISADQIRAVPQPGQIHPDPASRYPCKIAPQPEQTHPAYDTCKSSNPCKFAPQPEHPLRSQSWMEEIQDWEIQNWEKWVETKINEWEKDNLIDEDLWNQYLNDFDEWTEKDFKSDVSHALLRRLRDTLRRREVWVSRDEKITIEKALYNTLQEKTPPRWTEEEVLRYLPHENFISIIIKIHLKTNFGRKPPPPVPPRPVSSTPSKRQSTSLRFPKFFQSSKFPSVFSNRQLYSELPPIPSYRQPPTSSENQSTSRQSTLTIENPEHPPTIDNSEHPDEPRDGLPDKQPDEQPDDESSVDRSFKPLATENLRPPVEPPATENLRSPIEPPATENLRPPVEPSDRSLDGPSDESSDEPPVELPDEPSVGPLDGSLIEQSFKSPTSSLISSRSSHLPPQNQLEKQPDEQSDEQPNEQSLRQSNPSSPPSENQSTGRQSPPITANLEHPDGPSVESPDGPLDGPLDEPPVGPPVEPPDEPLVEPSDGSSVEQSSKPPTPPPPSPRPTAPPTPVNQLGGQPRRQLMRQLMRRATIESGRKFTALNKLYTNKAKFINTAIHVRCGIGWIESTLLNETGQWLLNNRADGTVLPPF